MKRMKHKVGLLFLAELLFLLCWIGKQSAVKPMEKTWENDVLWQIQQEELTLERGIYEVTVSYTENPKTDGGWIRASGRTNDERGLWCDTVSFEPEKEEIHFPVWVNQKNVGQFGFVVEDMEGSIIINRLTIQTSWNSKLYGFLGLLLKLAVLDGLVLIIGYRERLRKYSVELTGILVITLICSLGMFTRYLIMGHDAMFHMNRIEGLKDALLMGEFPVRIQPTWNHGWGYAVSLMYGDLTLLLPAVMRICGFTVTTAWKTFHVLMNLATAGIAYYSFYQMSRRKKNSLFAALLYCTAGYRLACIYIRSAVGEAAVMMFLPLVALFFWYAFGEETENENYGTRLVAPVLGFTGMLQTHVLTCEMAALFMIILCILMYRKLFRRKTLCYVAKVAVFSVLVNLWFLIPFLRMFREDLLIMQMSEMRDDFQIWGLSITELFATSPSRAYYFTFGENTSLANKCTLTIGTALWGSVLTSGLLAWNHKLQKSRRVWLCLGMGLLAAFMTTSYFPYSLLKEYFPAISTILCKVQFSYRFLGLTSLFFVLAIFFTGCSLQRKGNAGKYMLLACVVLGTVAMYQGMDYQYQILYGGTFTEKKFSEVSLNSADVVTGEYLYQGTDVSRTKTEQSVTGENVEMEDVQHHGLRFQILGKATGEGAYLEVPAFYYPGYVAKDLQGKQYQVTRSEDNNRIRVELPADFNGVLEVFYKEPTLFLLGDVISVLAVIGLIGFHKIEKFGEKKWSLHYKERF